MERAQLLNDILNIIPIILYAETHYRFKYFLSFLKKNEPEIITDVPRRIEPYKPLPVLILIKDAHKYPVELLKINIKIKFNGAIIYDNNVVNDPLVLNNNLHGWVIEVPLKNIYGNINTDVVFEIKRNNKKYIYKNDNYKTSSHSSLTTFLSNEELPKFKNLFYGECHSHSIYTNDQVEFGAPIQSAIMLSKNMGLSFFCVTDHSYDLDDMCDNYLRNDPELTTWKMLQKEVNSLNQNKKDFIVVRGEEVSCRNSKNKNVHLLLYGNKKFYYGSGDSAEKWLKTFSENSVSDVVNNLEKNVVAVAAHPKEKVSLLQKLLLGRDVWHDGDFDNLNIIGIQFANGKYTGGFNEGYKLWINLLLKGKRIFAIAGNDAHGNFNRFRQVGIPFVKITENNNQLFGKMKTGIFINKLNEQNIINAIKNGRSIVTDGPIVNMLISPFANKLTSIGDIINRRKKIKILLEAKTTKEYGCIKSLKLFSGIIGGAEKIIFQENMNCEISYKRNLEIDVSESMYIRTEVWTSELNSADKTAHFCFTNPIWINYSDR